jgi:ATP-dependent RNA helicase DDX49/DBP8
MSSGSVSLFSAPKKKKKLRGDKQKASSNEDAAKNIQTTSKVLEVSDDPNSYVTFTQLGLHDWLVKTCHAIGFVHPTPVQRHCIPPILAGRNVIGSAETGSGKTAAFALPILHKLSEDPYGIFALVLTPTRYVCALLMRLINLK